MSYVYHSSKKSVDICNNCTNNYLFTVAKGETELELNKIGFWSATSAVKV